jgi:hypothetical protein
MRFFTRATLAFDDRIPYDLSFALKEIFVELGIATVHGTTSLLKFLSSDLGKIERLAKEKSVPFPLVLKILHEKGNGR